MKTRCCRMFYVPVTLTLCAAPLMASGGTTLAPAQPRGAAAQPVPIHRNDQTRRPQFTQYCTGKGLYSFVGGIDNNVAAAQDSGILAGAVNQACGQYDAVSGGSYNAIFPNGGSDYASFIGAGENNAVYSNGYGGTYGSFIGAGNSNSVTAWFAAVGSGHANLIDTAGADSFIGAGDTNSVNGEYAFIGAGASNAAQGTGAFVGAGLNNVAGGYAGIVAGSDNRANGRYALIGSGAGNSAGAYSFVGSGQSNAAGLYLFAHANVTDAFVGSGTNNTALGNDSFIGAGSANQITGQNAFVGAGTNNLLHGSAAVIGGGAQNQAAGAYAVIPGGLSNTANGTASFAAGTKSGALHNGTFVWSDDAGSNALNSTAPYQFLARASGGFYLYSNAADTAGVKLAPGSGTWASLSDRFVKTGIVPLDDADVLEKVARLPVSEWSYLSERGVRHVGPMAQDFYAAFQVGEDNRHITTVDEDGIALAAVKALYAKNIALRSDAAALRNDMAALHAQNASLQRELAALEARVAALSR